MNEIRDLVYAKGRDDGIAAADAPQSNAAGNIESRLNSPENLIPADCEWIRPEMLTLVELEQDHIDSIVATVPGGARNVQDIYSLSPLQEGMLFHHLMNGGNDTYLYSTLFELPSCAQKDAFVAALQMVIERHDVLRTAVLWKKLPQPVQVVYRKVELQVEEVGADEGCEPGERLRQRMDSQDREFDLTLAPLLRLAVARAGEACWHVLMQVHHLVCDYQTKLALLAEIESCIEGRGGELRTPAPYRNFVAHLQTSAQVKRAEPFFRGKLSDISEPTAPFGLYDVHTDGRESQQATESLGPELAQRIRSRARRCGANTPILFHAGLALVVAGTSGRDDVVYGTVLSARPKSPQAQHMLGMFINTLPLRLRLQDITAKELVARTHKELAELWQYAGTSLTVAQRSSGIAGAAPLFTTILNYVRGSADPESKATVVGLREIGNRGVGTNYSIAVQVNDLGEDITLTAQTDRRIDPHRVIGYVRTAMQSLVEALEHSPQTPALALSILSANEQRQLVEQFNATHEAYATDSPFHRLVEAQAERTPHAIAVICGERQLTYAQLNHRANQIAHALIERGVQPDARVGLFVERSVEMVAALLGILKAGGAYVPMDISYPRERLRHMVTDSEPVVLLTRQQLREALPTERTQVLALDSQAHEIDSMPERNPDPAKLGLHSRHLAYVIYTSGSTGVPKGVAIEHRNLVNLVRWHCDAFEITSGSLCSSVAAVGFDAAGWEIWPPLSVGATLVLAPSKVATDVEQLMDWWSTQSLDVSFLPTPMAEFVFSRGIRTPRLRTLLVGGDRLRHRPAASTFALVNNYGPTEATVVATSGRLTDDDSVIHIGRPIANTQIYILDSKQRPVPIGVAGEMCVGGAGVARGYLNRPELTAERFVADPFSAHPESRLYRTGDLARWRADGTIEYLGRNDHQVKIRGYRIELGEIEAQLARHPQVKEAVVVAREDVPGEKHLFAYFTPDEQCAPAIEELRAYLKSLLPHYMVPAAFVMLERFPLTPNGKLDERALPAPALGAFASGDYEPPQGAIEERLAGIWKELLRVDRVGRLDNFFELGGHSLLAVNSLFNINEAFGCSLKVTDVYGNPTLSELATRIGGRTTQDNYVDLSKEATLDDDIVAVPGQVSMPAKNVLLTGATGFIGRFLLAQLIEDTDATIHCLVRGQSQQHALSRLHGVLTKWNLWRDGFERRIVAIPGDMGRPRLGIEADAYEALARSVDSIYHCATSMNHLESYAMAKPTNVDSTRELLKLATHHKPKLVNYISTLGVFGPRTESNRIVDESSPIDYEKHSTASGYVASKWVGEKIFMTAAERGIPCNIFRVGLVWADTQQGRYDELQQVYRLFKSCLLSGYGIQNYRPLMPPTPVDYVARSIVHLATQPRGEAAIFHLSSTKQSVDGIFERCNEIGATSLKLLPYYDWIREIERLHHAGQSLPAVPLIEFAFSMDEASFNERQENIAVAKTRFDCVRTHRELEKAGIATPSLDDDVLKVYVARMLRTDADLQGSIVPAARECSTRG